MKALAELEEEKIIESECYSAYDITCDKRYYPTKKYTGFKGNRILFVLKSLLKAKQVDQIIFGHINLAPVSYLMKFCFPKKQFILITHGIEVWPLLSGFKKILLNKTDIILTVSEYTRRKLIEVQHADASRIIVFHNTLDPYFSYPCVFTSNAGVREKYGLLPKDDILFSLTRLSLKEKFKGYDIIIQCLPRLLQSFPEIKYILGGKYDVAEKIRIDQIIQENNLEGKVILTGFIKNENLVHYYQMSDVFILPSKKEGFGIVFIEALACGLPVIAGNQDGSTDALKNGELGTLINPDDKEEIILAIQKQLKKKGENTPLVKEGLQQKTQKLFGFEKYKTSLKKILLQQQHS